MAKPEDKPMKMQWVEIDGRSTPIVLPQIWDHDKEDWIVTSTDNPLPTQVTGSIVEKLFEEDVEVPAGSSELLIEHNEPIPVNVKSFNVLINDLYSKSKDWEIELRYSTGDNTGTVTRRLQLYYDKESFNNIEPKPSMIESVSHLLNQVPRMGDVWAVYLFNNDEEEDLEVRIRIEGVIR